MNPHRRNGKQASCEPCRKNKTRCDHAFPICNRCQQRGIPDRCFYHPAPLTRTRDERLTRGKRSPRAHENGRPRPPHEVMDGLCSGAEGQVATPDPPDTTLSRSYDSGYLGPTSYAAMISLEDHTNRGRSNSVESDLADHGYFMEQHVSKQNRLQIAADVLRCLRFVSLIEKLVAAYYGKAHAAIAPAPFVLNALATIKNTVERYDLEKKSPESELTALVLSNTSKPLEIPPHTTGSTFHELYTGANLRLEIIGLILNITARTVYIGLANDISYGMEGRHLQPRFAHELFRASSACLELCKALAPINPLLLWLYYDNCILASIVCGDTSPLVWRRLGDLTGETYALGIHREASCNTGPFFFMQLRRRMFCSIYHLDKSLSTLLGRPPRVCMRHANVELPLDLRDEDLVASPAELEIACNALDSNGWNTTGSFHRATWNRLRYLLSQFREQIMDHSLGRIDEGAELALQDISRRGREMWRSVPEHMHYKPSCWNDDQLPSSACLMLVIAHLSYLFNEFLIQKLLDKRPLTQNSAYMSVSMELLSTVLALGQPRDRVFDTHKDFSYTIICFGVPSGSVLVTALQEQSVTGEAFPAPITRSEIIRNLSVLISNLESVARPGEGNYAICRKAGRTFTRLVDEILDPRPSATSQPSLDLGFITSPGQEGLESMDMSEIFENMDWGAGGQWAF